jgi:hypothetical protein
LGPPKNKYGYPEGFKPVEAVHRGLLNELQHAKVFQHVGAVDNEREAEGADLIVKAELLSTRFRITWITYGTSAFSYQLTGLSLVLPMCSLSQELKINLALLRPGERTPIWTGKIDTALNGSLNAFAKYGIAKKYISTDINCDLTSSAHQGQILYDVLARGMAEFTVSLVRFLREQPGSFWEPVDTRSRPAVNVK